MNGRAPRLGWVPPFVVGASAAIAAEVAAAILLYDGLGLLRSLTTILAVEAGAFGAGLWNAPDDRDDLAERIRVRWVACLSAFLVAAIYGTAWSVTPWLGDGRWAQGLGLALVGGVPLYAAGAVISGLSVAAATDRGGRLRAPGPAASTGVAAGVVLAGFLLPRAPLPASLLVACLVLLSFGGLIFGSVLGARTQHDERARRPGLSADVRVEDRSLPGEAYVSRVLLEGDFLRREAHQKPEGPLPWDVAFIRTILRNVRPAGSEDIPRSRGLKILHVGGGASPVARCVRREDPSATIVVTERVGAVIELGRDYFDTELTISRDDRVSVSAGNLDDTLEAAGGGYDVVLVDTLSLAPIGGVVGLSTAAMRRLYDSVGSDGVLVWGPLPVEQGRPEVAHGWTLTELRRDVGTRTEHLIVVRRSGGVGDTPLNVDGFEAVVAGGDAS